MDFGLYHFFTLHYKNNNKMNSDRGSVRNWSENEERVRVSACAISRIRFIH